MDSKVARIEATLNIMNETMKLHIDFLKLLGDQLNLKVSDLNIVPTKEESQVQDM
jgi:hypothetical protein